MKRKKANTYFLNFIVLYKIRLITFMMSQLFHFFYFGVLTLFLFNQMFELLSIELIFE